MIRTIIQEELIKNNHNLEKLKHSYQIFFDEFDGNKEYNLISNQKDLEGMIYISLDDAVNFKIYIDNVGFSTFNGTQSKVISVLWDKSNNFRISGVCKNLKIYITNVNCEYVFNKQIIPLTNSILLERGDFQLLSYSNYNSVISNSLTLLKTFSNVCSIQSVVLNNTTYIACLYLEDNKVYLCTSMNNYNDKILILENINNAVIVPKMLGGMTVVYIKDNKLYYKDVANDMSVGEETIISVNIKHIPVRFENISFYSLSMEIFAVKWSNNNVSIFQYNSGKFTLLTTIKSNNSSIFVGESDLNIVVRNKNKVVIYKYSFTISNGNVLLTFYGSYSLRNVNDCIKVDNYFLFENDGEYLAIEENNI